MAADSLIILGCLAASIVFLIAGGLILKVRKHWAKNTGAILVIVGVACMIYFIVGVATAPSKPKTEAEAGTVSAEQVADESVTFEEIYQAYKENELRADDVYKYNRYRITAKVNGMETGGLFNLTGGATLTMEKQVGDTIVFFYAEFEKEQEDALKTINVGDTITFEGKCLDAGNWEECELITG